MPLQPVLIVGAGPAGLATAGELGRRGIAYRLVERGDRVGYVWENLYDSLVLHTGKHMSGLPRMAFPRGDSLFPTRAEFVRYLNAYARAKGIVAETGCEVTRLERRDDGWHGSFADGSVVQASQVVMATGIVSRPRYPEIPGRADFTGRILHSVDYHRPAGFEGKRVLVVGVGNSGGEIGSELARHGAKVTVLVRSGQNVVPKQIGPFPAQYIRYLVGKLPRGAQEVIFARVQRRIEKKYGPPVLPRSSHSVLDAIPLIGFNLVDCIREGLIEVRLGTIDRLTASGARFSDGSEAAFDVVLLATGFEAAIDALGPLVRRDTRGFAVRTDRVTSADQPGLWFVGHNYDHTGGLTNIRTDSRLVARGIASRP
jgi:cation diffusion facilitator CzcD-associated flavoprotein CzcO